MIRQHHRITHATALTLAITATAAPCAWADPAPLARAEAAITATHRSALVRPNPDEQASLTYAKPVPAKQTASPRVQPNPDQQPVAGVTASTGRTSEVVSGGGYRSGSVPATTVRVVAADGSFDWGAAGIGAGASLVLVGIGLAGTRAATSSRKRHTREQRATAAS